MKNEIVLPPDWLNLGDINGVKVGDEVVTLKIKDGKAVDICGPTIVAEITEERVRTKHGTWLKKYNGACLAFMGYYTFYYSANPKHISTAKKNAQAAVRARKQKEIADKKNLREFMQKLDALQKEYGASFDITFGEGSDTHGIYDEAIVVSVGGLNTELLRD